MGGRGLIGGSSRCGLRPSGEGGAFELVHRPVRGLTFLRCRSHSIRPVVEVRRGQSHAQDHNTIRRDTLCIASERFPPLEARRRMNRTMRDMAMREPVPTA
jgi:hypothetical protein